MYSFSYLEPVCCSMFSSNCCFLTCIQISQEAGKVVWYSHLVKNFLQFIVIHTVKGFGIVNKAEIDVFLELSCFFNDPVDVGNLISGRWWNSSWAISNLKGRCCESAALNMPAHLENSAVATEREKVSFHSDPKERQWQRMLKLPHNCTHLTH